MEKLFVANVRFCMMQENFFFVKPIYKMQYIARHVDGLEKYHKNLTDDLTPVFLSNSKMRKEFELYGSVLRAEVDRAKKCCQVG